MEPIDVKTLVEYGIAGFLVFVLFMAWREFKSVLLTLSDKWIAIIEKMEAESEQKLSKLTEEFTRLREDFNRAVNTMEERTRNYPRTTPRRKDNP